MIGGMIRNITILLLFAFCVGQDISGSYQFHGLYIINQSVARYDTPILVSDIYNLGVTLPIDQIDSGEIYRTTYQGPYGHLYAEALNVILNINFNSDGTGQITEGSYYPTETVEDCIADIAILPIVDELLYSSDLNAGLIIPSTNILGSVPDDTHNPLPYSGQTAGSLSLSQSGVFDFFPATPVHPTLCDAIDVYGNPTVDANCFDVILENGETIPGGDPLPGFSGGYVLMGDLTSIAPSENDCADVYIEWHAIDGPISQSGLGDIIGADEDGDGTDFDRIWAKESVTVTAMTPGSNCGYNYPIFNNISEQPLLAECVDHVREGNEGYIWDESYSNWGNFLTFNAMKQLPDDDSGHDFNGKDGRLVMRFDPMCIQDINVRHMMLEFIHLDEEESCLDTK